MRPDGNHIHDNLPDSHQRILPSVNALRFPCYHDFDIQYQCQNGFKLNLVHYLGNRLFSKGKPLHLAIILHTGINRSALMSAKATSVSITATLNDCLNSIY